MSQTINKIGFYVVDKRHYDYFGNVWTELQKRGIPFELIINDQLSEVKQSVKDEYDLEMVSIAKHKGHSWITLTDVLKKGCKYKVFVTTFTFKFGVRSPETTLIENVVRRGYRAIQKILRLFRSNLFSESLESWYRQYELDKLQLPEVLAGQIVVQFPKGMDIHLAKFPDPQTKDIIDLYLCHGDFDSNLVQTRTKKPCAVIGYPRYDNLVDPELKLAKNIRTEFGIPSDKPIVAWLPTYVPRQGNDDFNIDSWAPFVAELTKNFAVIVRPHPKRVERDREILNDKLSSFGFYVDLVAERDMSELYAGAAFTLCDYGGVVFSSVYTDQNLILLNHPEHDSEHQRKENLIVYQIRDQLLNVGFEQANQEPDILIKLTQNKEIWDQQSRIRDKVREQFFGGVEAGRGSELAAEILDNVLSEGRSSNIFKQ